MRPKRRPRYPPDDHPHAPTGQHAASYLPAASRVASLPSAHAVQAAGKTSRNAPAEGGAREAAHAGAHYFIQFIKNNVFLRPGSCGAAGSGGPPHAPGLWMPLVATPPLAPRGNIYHLKESPKSPPQVWACFRRVSVSYCQLRSRSGVSATPAVAPALQRQAGTTRRGRGGRGPQEAVCLAGELCV